MKMSSMDKLRDGCSDTTKLYSRLRDGDDLEMYSAASLTHIEPEQV